MSDDEAHEDIDDNFMRPFWRHAQIEEQNAQFHETIIRSVDGRLRIVGEGLPERDGD